ncbi:Hypothetical protein KVN_LOCUS93 [uncultured virus]|nr:Hypothetical protein KVN_LOCUS93 [uncultured virus]
MTDRNKRLNQIKNDVEQINKNTLILEDIIKEIKTKFGNLLESYIFIENSNLIKRGFFIFYVNIHLDKIRGGIVSNIIYDNSGLVNLLILRNLYKNVYWKIKPKKNYIFFYNRAEQNSAFRKNINKIIKKFNIDIHKKINI